MRQSYTKLQHAFDVEVQSACLKREALLKTKIEEHLAVCLPSFLPSFSFSSAFSLFLFVGFHLIVMISNRIELKLLEWVLFCFLIAFTFLLFGFVLSSARNSLRFPIAFAYGLRFRFDRKSSDWTRSFQVPVSKWISESHSSGKFPNWKRNCRNNTKRKSWTTLSLSEWKFALFFLPFSDWNGLCWIVWNWILCLVFWLDCVGFVWKKIWIS